MDRFWERYIQSRPAPGESKGAFDAFAAAHRDPGPRNMADGGRIGLKPGGIVEPGVMYYGQKKSEAHKKAMSETKQKKGFKRYITSFDNYEGERKDIKKYNLKEWKALDASQKNQAMKKVEMKLEPGVYEGEFAQLTQKQREARRKRIRIKYHTDPEVRAKAITKASERYYEIGEAKAKYKADMEKTKGKATLAKEKNRLLKYMEQSAFKWENPKYKQILDANGNFVGVKDLSHKIDGQYKTYVPFEQYETRYKNKKNYLPITKHRDYSNFETFFKAAKRFKMEAPDRLLGSYFQKYNRVPSYSEIYNFFERDPRSAPRAYQQNSLEIHHRNLMANSPTRNLQLTLFDRNNAATSILKGYDNPDNKKLYKNLEAVDKELKRLKVRVKVGNRMLGIGEMLPEESLSDAKKQTVKIFREELKKVGTEKSRWGSQQELFDDMAKKLKLLCPKGKALGGRIGFQTAGSAVSTLECGRRAFTKLANSKNKTPQQISAIKEILRMGSGLMRGVGTMLNPAEFFKLKNLIGPGAWAAMGAFEAGAIGYDTINRNTPLNEALSDNWVTGWAMPWTKKEAQIKNLGDRNISCSPAMQKYMEQVKLMAEYERGEKVLTGLKTRYGDQERAKVLYENQQGKLDKINNDWVNLQETAMVERDGEMVPVTGGELEFQKAVSDMAGERKAGHYDPSDLRNINEYGYADVGESAFKGLPIIGDWFKQGTPLKAKETKRPIYDLPPSITGKKDFEDNVAYYQGKTPFKGDTLTLAKPKRTYTLKDFTQPDYRTATTTPLGEGELEGITQYGRDIGYLHPRFGEMSEEDIKHIQAIEKWRQLFEQSPTGLHGAKFAGGGMVGIRKPNAIAPTGGPMHQGLRSLYINDKDY